MTSQIFKNAPPKKIMYDFLDNYAIKNNTKYYYISKIIFRQANLKNDIDTFCNQIKVYYHKSKQHYATRTQNYKTFMTIFRQICKHYHIPFTSKIKYDKSQYRIDYYIYPSD